MDTLISLPALETPHLLLRELVPADAKDFSLFMMQTRYQRYIAHRMHNEAEVAAFVGRHVAGQSETRRNVYHLAAEEKHSGDAVGDGFLIDHGERNFEIGWGLHPALWRMGFGTEIGSAMLAIGFEHLKAANIFCKIMRPNVASQRLAIRIGMVPGKTVESYPVGQGRMETVDHFSLTQDGYFNAPY
jgi:[ribosomal protein S5]-alanine N-acetyltransferase